jgi:hypothetical protein
MTSTETIDTRVAQVAHAVREHVVHEADGVIHGITFDGRRMVLATGARLIRVAPESGRVIDQFETFPDRGGLAYDGRCLWQHSEGRLQQLDRRTGFVLRSISPPVSEITGLGSMGRDLLVLHASGRALARVETLDSTCVTNVDLQGPMYGLAWVARRLWSSNAGGLCCIDPDSGRVVARVELPEGIEACDLAGDIEGRVWCVDGRTRVLRAFATD